MRKVNDLYLLLGKLSQMQDRDLIMQCYLEGINTFFAPLVFAYAIPDSSNNLANYKIATPKATCAGLVQKNEGSLGEADKTVLVNSLNMLAVILERLVFKEKLQDEGAVIERAAGEHSTPEEKLLESYSLLRIAGDTAKFGGWSVNLNTGQLTWSDQVALIHEMPLGYSPHLEDGIKFYAPEWQNRIRQVFSDCAEKGIPYDEEMEIITARGRRVWVRTTAEAVRDANGQIVKIQGSFQDINELKLSELARQENERRISTLMANLPGMAYRCRLDRDWTMELVSQGCYKLTGYQPEDLIGNKTVTYEDVTHPADRSEIRKEIKESVKEGKPFTLEYRIIDAAGDEKWVWERGRTVPGEQSDEIMLEGFISDITDRKMAEAEVRALSEDLEQRVKERTAEYEAVNKELESFAYSVSHDLRAPLRALDGFSGYLLEHYAEQFDQKGQHYLKRIRKAALYMSELIDDLLRLSRVTRSEFNKKEVDLSKWAVESLKALHEAEPDRKVEVKVAPNLKSKGDPHLLRPALENLLGNAWKFSKCEGTAVIEVGANNTAGDKVFFVSDNGVGFDMQYADKLFGPFQRLHGTDQFPGTGIGLATVQRIINRHGGRIWAESEEGRGATFYFVLPE